MKYIKTYEKMTDKEFTSKNRYWRVCLDSPIYEISLEKIGMTDDEQEEFIKFRDQGRFNTNHIYIELYWEGIGSKYYYGESVDDFISDTPEYMGDIEDEITPEEYKEGLIKLDQNKYNL